jgi:hypothetical protein
VFQVTELCVNTVILRIIRPLAKAQGTNSKSGDRIIESVNHVDANAHTMRRAWRAKRGYKIGEEGFEPSRVAPADFKSAAYAVPPLARIPLPLGPSGSGKLCEAQRVKPIDFIY